MSEDRPVSIALDRYGREALEHYLAACDQIANWQEVKVKARDVLVTYLRHHEADIGTVDGRPVVRYIRTEALRLDEKALKEAELATYRRFVRRVSYEQLRPIR